MRVSVDDRPLRREGFRDQGIGRYARGLLSALEEVAPERGGELVPGRRADVRHFLSPYDLPLLGRGTSVVTLHDLAPLRWPREYLRSGIRHRLMYRAVRRCDAVICPSEAAAADATELLGIEEKRITVIAEAADERFAPTERRLDLPGPYALYVGSLDDPRKDVGDLAAAWSRTETLVLAGRGRAPAHEGALALGFVPEGDLAALYSGATCFVTASRYEGFGLPALESIACGTPVAAYDTGAIPSTAGPGALLVAPGDVGALVGAAGRLFDEPQLRARLSRAGLEHAARFSWRRAAEATWDVYESLLSP